MIIAESVLAPYRSKEGKVYICESLDYRTPPLPREIFSSSLDIIDDPPLPGQENEGSSDSIEVSLVLAFTGQIPILKAGREWLALRHQCGGHSCQQVKMIATRLEPRAAMLPDLKAIAKEGYGAETGHFDTHQLLASRLAKYIITLEGLGVDCECTWRHLSESIYPVDATQKNLELLAKDPPNIDTIADWHSFIQVRYSPDPVIFLLSENSD